MRVLLLGATGLIGSAVLAQLARDGVEVVAVARTPGMALRHVRWLPLDVAGLTAPEEWLPHLAGVSAVVNCAGALASSSRDDLRGVHVDGVAALYRACEEAGVRRVVHVSAIGAEREPLSEFSATKKAGEDALTGRDLDWVVLRPAVVVGRATYGGSALLRGLAALPVLPELPDAGQLQIVQLDDLVESIVLFLSPAAPARLALDVAGPERLALTEAVLAYRRWLRLPEPKRARVPRPLAALGYRLGDLVRALGWRPPIGTVVRRELVRGAVGNPVRWQELTGIRPQPLAAALASEPASVQERWFARLYLMKPLAFAVLSAFWIVTGLVSLGPGWEPGLAYLLEGGVAPPLAAAGVVAGALVDIAVGVGIAVRRTAKRALWAAFAISIFYVVAGTWVLPRLWADPVGPMLKIWPIMVLNLVALAIAEDR
ncbi:MAG TPA: SDR family oxidoreductase [Gammaproteobacteria bacterium]